MLDMACSYAGVNHSSLLHSSLLDLTYVDLICHAETKAVL